MIVGILAVIFAVRPWVVLPTIALGVIFLWLRSFYMHSSRDIKRMEGIAKSPVFSHFSTSLQGKGKDQQQIRKKNCNFCRFDNHQSLLSRAPTEV